MKEQRQQKVRANRRKISYKTYYILFFTFNLFFLVSFLNYFLFATAYCHNIDKRVHNYINSKNNKNEKKSERIVNFTCIFDEPIWAICNNHNNNIITICNKMTTRISLNHKITNSKIKKKTHIKWLAWITLIDYYLIILGDADIFEWLSLLCLCVNIECAFCARVFSIFEMEQKQNVFKWRGSLQSLPFFMFGC